MLATKDAMATAWVMMLATSAAVALRVWIRCSRGANKFRVSDITIGVTGILGIICAATATALMSLSMRGPMTASQEILHAKLTIVALVNYWVLVWMVKASFLSLYWDIYERLIKDMRLVLVIGSVYAGLSFLVTIFVNLFWCRPISIMWTVAPTDPNYCFFINKTTLVTYFVLHLTSDVPVLYIPVRLIQVLKLSRTDLWGMGLVAAVGSVSIITSIIRFGILQACLNDVDKSQFLTKTIMWSCIEETAGQCASCLPAFRALLKNREANKTKLSSKGSNIRSKGKYYNSQITVSRAKDDNYGSETELQNLSDNNALSERAS